MKVRITGIHPFDAYHSDRDELIGMVGRAHGFMMSAHQWYSFDFVPEHLRTPIHLMYANFEVIR